MSAEGLYSSIATKCRVTAERDAGGGGIPQKSVLALSRPAGLKVPSLRRISTSNSWRSLATAKVEGMLRQVVPTQYLNMFLNWATTRMTKSARFAVDPESCS